MSSPSALVVVAETAQVLALLPEQRLGADAEARRDALRNRADRDDFVAARLLVAATHRAFTGEALRADGILQRCDRCGGAHGRPRPSRTGAHLSWSHSHGLVAAAVGADRLGVDIETSSALGAPVVEVLSPIERMIVEASADPVATFVLAWTAKEATAKAGGAAIDRFGELTVLAGEGSLVPGPPGLVFSTHRGAGFVATATTAGTAGWRSLSDGDDLLGTVLRAVGGAA